MDIPGGHKALQGVSGGSRCILGEFLRSHGRFRGSKGFQWRSRGLRIT